MRLNTYPRPTRAAAVSMMRAQLPSCSSGVGGAAVAAAGVAAAAAMRARAMRIVRPASSSGGGGSVAEVTENPLSVGAATANNNTRAATRTATCTGTATGTATGTLPDTRPPGVEGVMPDPYAAAVWGQHVFAACTWLRSHDAPTQTLTDPADPACAGVAVIVEPRLVEMPLLEAVVRVVVHHLAPRKWALQIWHGTTNASAVRALVADWPNVQLRDLGVANLAPAAASPSALGGFVTSGYNRLVCSPEFWEAVPHEHVLMFQTDSWMFTGAGLEAGAPLLAYDFVGAPWAQRCIACRALILPGGACCGRTSDDALVHALAPQLVGNGGFSLRRRAAMIDICHNYRLAAAPPFVSHTLGQVPTASAPARDERIVLPGSSAEDTFACTALLRAGHSVAPRAVAGTFAFEQTLPLLLPPPGVPWAIGAHKPYAYLSGGTLAAALRAYTLTDAATGERWTDPVDVPYAADLVDRDL